MKRAEEKFADELDIAKLLQKLRNSYDLTKNMVNKDFRSLMAFNKGRIIDPDSESCESSDVSSEGEEEQKNEEGGQGDKGVNFNDFVKLSVIRGIKMQSEEKQVIKDQIKKKKQVTSIMDALKQRTNQMRDNIVMGLPK